MPAQLGLDLLKAGSVLDSPAGGTVVAPLNGGTWSAYGTSSVVVSDDHDFDLGSQPPLVSSRTGLDMYGEELFNYVRQDRKVVFTLFVQGDTMAHMRSIVLAVQGALLQATQYATGGFKNAGQGRAEGVQMFLRYRTDENESYRYFLVKNGKADLKNFEDQVKLLQNSCYIPVELDCSYAAFGSLTHIRQYVVNGTWADYWDGWTTDYCDKLQAAGPTPSGPYVTIATDDNYGGLNGFDFGNLSKGGMSQLWGHTSDVPTYLRYGGKGASALGTNTMDDFNRAETPPNFAQDPLAPHTKGGGLQWVRPAGSWTLDGSYAKLTANGANSIMYLPMGCDAPNMQLKINTIEDQAGLVMFYKDASNYWKLVYSSGLAEYVLYERVGGVDGLRALSTGVTPANGDTMRGEWDAANSYFNFQFINSAGTIVGSLSFNATPNWSFSANANFGLIAQTTTAKFDEIRLWNYDAIWSQVVDGPGIAGQVAESTDLSFYYKDDLSVGQGPYVTVYYPGDTFLGTLTPAVNADWTQYKLSTAQGGMWAIDNPTPPDNANTLGNLTSFPTGTYVVVKFKKTMPAGKNAYLKKIGLFGVNTAAGLAKPTTEWMHVPAQHGAPFVITGVAGNMESNARVMVGAAKVGVDFNQQKLYMGVRQQIGAPIGSVYKPSSGNGTTTILMRDPSGNSLIMAGCDLKPRTYRVLMRASTTQAVTLKCGTQSAIANLSASNQMFNLVPNPSLSVIPNTGGVNTLLDLGTVTVPHQPARSSVNPNPWVPNLFPSNTGLNVDWLWFLPVDQIAVIDTKPTVSNINWRRYYSAGVYTAPTLLAIDSLWREDSVVYLSVGGDRLVYNINPVGGSKAIRLFPATDANPTPMLFQPIVLRPGAGGAPATDWTSTDDIFMELMYAPAYEF